MSSVHCLRYEPQSGTSWHRWIVSGGRRLHRQNKISSVLFALPEESLQQSSKAPKGDQFRLVFLRGAIKKKNESDDHYALLLEHVPATASAFAVRLTFLFGPSELTDRRREEISGELSTTSRTLGLKEAFSEEVYRELCFPGTDALCVDLGIHVETTVVSAVLTTSRLVGASLWGGASSTLAALGNAVSSMSGRVVHVLDEAFHTRQEDPRPADSVTSLCPWDSIPMRWVDRPQRWVFLLTQYLPQNDAVFLYGPRLFSSEEELALVEAGLHPSACVQAANEFNEESDIHDRLLAPDQQQLRSIRFELVPGRVSERAFWCNYYWRVNCLKLCATEEQVRVLLSILNAPTVGIPKKSASSGVSATGGATPVVSDPQLPSQLQTACELCRELRDEGVSSTNVEMFQAAIASLASLVEQETVRWDQHDGRARDDAVELLRSCREELRLRCDSATSAQEKPPHEASIAADAGDDQVEETRPAAPPQQANPASPDCPCPQRDAPQGVEEPTASDTVSAVSTASSPVRVPSPNTTKAPNDAPREADPSRDGMTPSRIEATFPVMPWEEDEE